MFRRKTTLAPILGLVALVAVAAWIWLSSEPTPPAASKEGVSAETPPAAGGPAEAAPPRDPSPDVPRPATDLNQQAMNAWTSGDIETAMALFEQAIAAAPNDPLPHSNYGRLLTLMVSYERAIPLLERARDLAPQDAQAWLDLATVYERAQRLDESWAARAEAGKLVGPGAIARDERGRLVVEGTSLW
jgi:tetratricopeptide (TPR) repeat protein